MKKKTCHRPRTTRCTVFMCDVRDGRNYHGCDFPGVPHVASCQRQIFDAGHKVKSMSKSVLRISITGSRTTATAAAATVNWRWIPCRNGNCHELLRAVDQASEERGMEARQYRNAYSPCASLYTQSTIRQPTCTHPPAPTQMSTVRPISSAPKDNKNDTMRSRVNSRTKRNWRTKARIKLANSQLSIYLVNDKHYRERKKVKSGIFRFYWLLI